MSKRLLTFEQALKKIELSLKLHGKQLSEEFLKCEHCKFSWRSINSSYWGNKDGVRWYCDKYKNAPDHAYIKYRVIRRDASGNEVYYPGATKFDYALQRTVPTIKLGETDELIWVSSFQPYRHRRTWGYGKVCRRFESNGKK